MPCEGGNRLYDRAVCLWQGDRNNSQGDCGIRPTDKATDFVNIALKCKNRAFSLAESGGAWYNFILPETR